MLYRLKANLKFYWRWYTKCHYGWLVTRFDDDGDFKHHSFRVCNRRKLHAGLHKSRDGVLHA